MTPEERAQIERDEARALKRIASLEADNERLRAQLAAFVPPGALSAGEIPALCGTCTERLCVPGQPGCALCVGAEVERLRDATTRYIGRIETLACENRVLNTRAEVRREQRDTFKAERDAAREQVKRVRGQHHPIAAHLGDPDDDDNLITACNECEVPYPCAIIRALDEAEADRG